MGTGGASSAAGELTTAGHSERASRHAACRPPAYIWVSFSPLPFVRPKNMHAHIYTCTYIYTSVHISDDIYPYQHKYTHAYIHTCIHTYIHTHIYTYINTYINKSIYLYMCAHPKSRLFRRHEIIFGDMKCCFRRHEMPFGDMKKFWRHEMHFGDMK